MFFSSPSNVKLFDPRGFFDELDTAATAESGAGAGQTLLQSSAPHPMLDLIIVLLHSPLPDIRRHVVSDCSLSRPPSLPSSPPPLHSQQGSAYVD